MAWRSPLYCLALLCLRLPVAVPCSFIVANYNLTATHGMKQIQHANFYNRLRGPDATNFAMHESWSFIHNLLSMTGAFTLQPFIHTLADTVAVFNGEIYNYKEVASELKLASAPSDGTVILPAYAKWGGDFVRHLNGEFAIVVVDFKQRTILLSTDTFSTKPLFYAMWTPPRTRRQHFVAASYESVLQRLSAPQETIHMAEPNEVLIFSFRPSGHMNLISRKPLTVFDLSQFKTHTRDWEAAFRESVRIRTASLKHRAFIGLSSGYDSGAIMLALHLARTKFMAYNIPAKEKSSVVQSRIRYCHNTSDSVVLTVSEAVFERERRWLQSHCEPMLIAQDTDDDLKKPCEDKAAVGLSVILSQVRSLGGLVHLSGSGADEIISDYGINGQKIFRHSSFAGVFPANLSTVYPWRSFYKGTQRAYLMKEELTGGAWGIEARYPFLDPHVVQEYLYLDHTLKNSEYKKPVADFLRRKAFPNMWGAKTGFTADANMQPVSSARRNDGRSGTLHISHAGATEEGESGPSSSWRHVARGVLASFLVLAAIAIRWFRSQPLGLADLLRARWHQHQIEIIVVMWFMSSVVTEMSDSIVMRQLKAPLTLALWKFVISIPCGTAVILAAGQPLPSSSVCPRWAILKQSMPLATMIVMAKLFTYVSYGRVPLSTAQIAKAATPVASVFLARSILGERFGWGSYLSLVPIVCGVCLGVGVGAHDVSLIGVFAALASCMLASAQGVYMKTIYLAEEEANTQSLAPLTLNLIVAYECVTLLLPLWLGVQVGLLPSRLDGGASSLLERQLHVHATTNVALIVGGLTQYVQSACAYLFLERVSPATSAVVGTARKPFIVLISVIAFSVPVSLLNVLGIVLTFGGVAWYNCISEGRRLVGKRVVEERVASMHMHGDSSNDEAASDEHLVAPSPRSKVQGFAACYEAQLAQRPLLVKAITSGVLYSGGDLLAQIISAARANHLSSRIFDHARFYRALLYGYLFYPPLAHAHYNFLEWLVVTKGLKGAMASVFKTVLEQFVYWSYFSNAYYHVVMGALQGFSPLECLHALAAKFWSTMLAQWSMWVPVQLVNFHYVPVRHQLGFVLVYSLLWSTFLSVAYPPDETSAVVDWRAPAVILLDRSALATALGTSDAHDASRQQISVAPTQ